jgi:hypothetical protein
MLKSTVAAIVCILLAAGGASLHAQGRSDGSIHRREAERHDRYGPLTEAQWDSVNGYHAPAAISSPSLAMRKEEAPCTLTRVVFGWSPSWLGTAYKAYDYSLLSDVCYFSYELDPATGNYTTVGNWKSTDLVPVAKAAGTRVHLCVTLFSGHLRFLGNSAARSAMIDSVVALLKLRGADGVNIDFEGMPAAARGGFTSFMTELGTRLHSVIPGSRVSIALPAVDWSNVFDAAAMVPYVDLFLIMGYDYHWKGAPEAGPVAPKNAGSTWGSIDVTRSVYTWLDHGIPPSKLALAVPYYGYEWPTRDSAVPSPTTGPGAAVTYAAIRAKAPMLSPRWDNASSTPYYILGSESSWSQGWYDDAKSLGAKYDLAIMKNLAGIGIWALGYDEGGRELWDALASHFTSCAHSPCEGTVADMGGPSGNYPDNDAYTYTIAPENAGSVKLTFYSFNVADDRLRIYDGRDTLAPLLGSFTGDLNPGTLTATSGAMTLAFASNAGKSSWGWIANWSCTSLPQGVDPAPHGPPLPSLTIEPNPLTTVAEVGYALPVAATVDLALYDLLGRKIATLDAGYRREGAHRVGIDRRGLRLAAGTMLLRLRAGDDVVERQVVVR